VGAGLADLRADSLLGRRTRELVNRDATAVALLVRAEDVGSGRADALAQGIRDLAAEHLPETDARIVGQWWLAQLGMGRIIHDTASSFLTSCLFVLGFVALVLRSRRLFLVSLLPNLLPMFAALVFMAMTGIPLRIGTALVLAIALGIAVDDTVHLMVRLKREDLRLPAGEAVLRAIADVGPAMICTTVVLMLGFLSMLWNDLLALRDMGMVGAFTLGVALLAELLLVPALFVLGSPRRVVDYVIRTPAVRHRTELGSHASGRN
jgi:predicted RND superfamily exporter protein